MSGDSKNLNPERTPEINQNAHHHLTSKAFHPRQKTPTIFVTDQDASEDEKEREEALETPKSVSSSEVDNQD